MFGTGHDLITTGSAVRQSDQRTLSLPDHHRRWEPTLLTLKVRYIAPGRVRGITVPPSLTSRGIRSACGSANS